MGPNRHKGHSKRKSEGDGEKIEGSKGDKRSDSCGFNYRSVCCPPGQTMFYNLQAANQPPAAQKVHNLITAGRVKDINSNNCE